MHSVSSECRDRALHLLAPVFPVVRRVTDDAVVSCCFFCFSLRLTFNYGISSYETGNDLIGLHVRVAGAADRARAKGMQVQSTEEAGVSRVQTPEGQWLYMHEEESASAPSDAADADPFLCVALSSVNLSVASEFYRRVLGMREHASSSSHAAAKAGVPSDAPWALLGYSALETKVLLVELGKGEAVSHAASFGRMAFGVSDVLRTFARATAASATVLHPPVTLDTPGKARVHVSILSDADSNEICVVSDSDFRSLCVVKPGDDAIKWEWREKAIAKQMKFQKAFNKDTQHGAAATAAASAHK